MNQIFEPGKIYKFSEVRYFADHVNQENIDVNELKTALILSGSLIVGTGGTHDRIDRNGESMIVKRSWCEEVFE